MRLETDLVTEGDAPPDRWLYVLHGIFGSGRNWRSVMRRLARERPDWGAVLIDLRQHGASQGFAPPHTVAAAAADLAAIAADGGPSAAAIMGHSFGGKVALARAAAAPAGLEQVWLVDSTPEARPPGGSAWDMLQLVKSLPDRYPDRDALISALTARGVARPVAQWMATNLEATDGGYRWRFDLEAIEALLGDFFETDLWHVVEEPPEGVEVHLVRAADSSVLSGPGLERAERATEGARTFLHTIEGGHWVNAENPEGILELLAHLLPRG